VLVCGNSKLGADLCAALGLKGASSLELRLAVDEVVTVKAELAVHDTQLGEVIKVLKQYNLVEKTDEEKGS
jgi:hypothetical protein